MTDDPLGGTNLPNDNEESATGGDEVPEPSPSLTREGKFL